MDPPSIRDNSRQHAAEVQREIQSIVVLGGGSAGFMAALLLRRTHPGIGVTLIRSPEVPPIGVGESTTPVVPDFLHTDLGIDAGEFYRAVRPTWKLGIRFDWVPEHEGDFYYTFDARPQDRPRGLPKDLGYFYHADSKVTTRQAEMMRRDLAPMLGGQPGGGYKIENNVAYHIENRPYVQFLEKRAADVGIRIDEDAILGAELDGNGAVGALLLPGGRKVKADLYVDCSGFRSELLGCALKEPFLDYTGSLFCDRAITGTWCREEGIHPFTSAETMKHGWCWRVELIDRVNRGYVYSSAFCTADEAEQEFRGRNPEMENVASRVLEFRPGRRENFWVKNVVGIGNAAGFMEPLEATGLHMVAVGARALATALLDNDRRMPAASMVREVNRYLARMWDDIRDCLAMHYKFNRRLETPFWKHCREMTDLAGAEEVVAYFRENGPSVLGSKLIGRDSIFGIEGYLTLLIGLGVGSRYRFEPGEAESALWRTYLGQIYASVSGALPMDEALRLIQHPRGQWGAGHP